MLNFLIKIEDSGTVVDIVWSDPSYLFLASSDNLFQHINFDQWTQLEQDIAYTKQTQKTVFSNTKYRFKVSDLDVYLFMIRIQDRIYVLGHEMLKVFERKTDARYSLVYRFLETIVLMDANQAHFSEASKTNYYEKIQALNNDLINMQRQLHKANAQLNQLNLTLNNRLVKDPLTGLISRYQYQDEISLLIRKAPQSCGIFAFIDIDDFKEVNDTYGHQVGDEYLKAFANSLDLIQLPDILKIRIAGDEFGLYTHGYTPDEAYAAIDKMMIDINDYIMNQVFEIDGYHLNVNLSIGFAIYNLHSDNIYQLIDYADFAMYQAKKSGKASHRVFNLEDYQKFKENQ